MKWTAGVEMGRDDEKRSVTEVSCERIGYVDEELESWFNRSIKILFLSMYEHYILELLLRQTPLPPSKDGRHIPIRAFRDAPLVDERTAHSYVSNSIRSARYTIWDFLPKQFFFQATRLSNFYFICIGVPQAIPGLSTTGNYTTILPLCFFILLTIFKEGYDDFRRHRLDNVENNQMATVSGYQSSSSIATSAKSTIWKILVSFLAGDQGKAGAQEQEGQTVGKDVDDNLGWFKVRWKDIKVGDIVMLQRDESVPADVVLLYADGENGLAYIETMALDGETNLKSKQAPEALRCCATLHGLKECDAEVVSEDPNRNLYDYNGRVVVGGKSIPLTLNEVIFRGSVLRNTGFAICLVINTGEECKIRMNANHHPKAKKPHLERYANQVVLTLIVYVVLLSVGLSMGYIIWHQNFEVHAWYLNNSYVSFKQIIIGYLIMFNNVIPLALYISLEIVKIGQMLMISSDLEMYDAKTNVAMTCNTNTILENLGQVGYVLSDKTGTLTENVMRFRKMSIAGIALVHATNNDPKAAIDGGGNASITIENRRLSRTGMSQNESRLSFARSRSTFRTPDPTIDLTTADMISHMRRQPSSNFSKKARSFILGMALCHTALPETGACGDTTFQASSPDELALLKAAQDLGYLMIQRSSNSVTLLIREGAEQARLVYEVLDIVEFSSKRKRMSIIVRCPDERIWLICKGADNVIIPRLQQASMACRTSREVRRSLQLERDMQRRSASTGPRHNFGDLPSLISMPKGSMDIRPDPKTAMLDVPKRSHEVRVHTRSLEVEDMSARRPSIFFDSPATEDDGIVFSRCFRHLDDFAKEGLRTLLFADKFLLPSEYSCWKKVFSDASTSLINRQRHIEAAADMMEQGLSLLGASAIEDKLQIGVPETIDKLRRANIKIWMLTGDKRETAINIANAAQICKPESEIWVLDASKGDLESQLSDAASDIFRDGGLCHTVLVVDGQSLASIELNAGLKQTFYSIIVEVDSVICCRASPAQKAGIVRAIRARLPLALTLAIGDGANDVAMIQASHVGVGISGKEGLQAARVADYSIAQFRFLQRLLLVHGRWNYVRTAKFILHTFWKEMFFYMMQALYQRSNGYTGTSLYENWSLTVLNTLFTSLCVIVPGIFEQDLKADTLLAVPELYVYGQRNMGLHLSKTIAWIILAAAEGMIVWFISWAAFDVFHKTGDNGLFALGDLCFSLGIVWTNLKLLLLETHYKTAIVGGSFMITFAGWWAWNGFMSSVYEDNLSPYDVKGGFTSTFGNDPNWWLTMVIVLAVLTSLEILYKSLAQSSAMVNIFVPWKRWRKGRECESKVATEKFDVGLWQRLERHNEIKSKAERMDSANICDDESDERCDFKFKPWT